MPDLRMLADGATRAEALGVNASGVIVGRAVGASGTMSAVLWADSSANPAELDGLGGGSSEARALSASLAVGSARTGDGRTRAVAWDLSTRGATRLPDADARWTFSRACAVNDTGIAVGVARAGKQTLAVRWDLGAGTVRVLDGLGGPAASAEGINAQGTVVGWASIVGDLVHAVRWSPDGIAQDLVDASQGPSRAAAVSADELIVGWQQPSSVADEADDVTQLPACWAPNRDRLAIPTGPFPYGRACAIASTAVVGTLGYGPSEPDVRAFLFDVASQHLTELLPPASRLSAATAINSSGLVVGWREADDGAVFACAFDTSPN